MQYIKFDLMIHGTQTQELVELKTKLSILKFGYLICLERWENVVHQPLMNVMQICKASDVFIDPIDTTSSTKDANYIAIHIKRYVVKVNQKMSSKCALAMRRPYKTWLELLALNGHTYIGKGM